MITKSDYLQYAHCPKRFWLSQHHPAAAAMPDAVAQRRFRAGQEVDKLARERFAEGVHIPYRPHPEEMVPLTHEALAQGADAIFQGTFAVDDQLIKADVLERGHTGYHLIEVKSTTSTKPAEHLPDITFQADLIERSGLNIERCSIMHLNNRCRYPDLSDLFTLSDVTADVQASRPRIPLDVAQMRAIAKQPSAPDVRVGRHCSKPHVCPFHEFCWRGIEGLTIYDVPRLSEAKEQALEADGVLYWHEIPDDFPLSEAQRRQVALVAGRQIEIDRPAIADALNELAYPLYFLDFETIDHAVPRYNGCRPYQQLPFQHSCHILQADGSLTHREYLHTEPGDPRPALVAALLADIGSTGHVVAYYAPFEGRVLRELSRAFPAHSDRLTAIAERLWDQLDIFKRSYRDHRFGKSNSLKSVLPVVVPELSYGALAVQDGLQAQVVWEEMIACENGAAKQKMVEQLLAYCTLDTMAMVEIHRALGSLG
jgi:CRISPR/Cas system-associated exonuclease Cas4 (RecB family)